MIGGERKPWLATFGVRLLAASAVCLLLAAGLCGIGFRNDRAVHDGAPSTFDVLGGLMVGLAVLSGVIGLVAVIFEVLARVFKVDRE